MFRIESKSIYSDPIDFGADIIDDKADDPVAAPTQSIKSIIEDRSNGILARNWAGIEQLSFAGSDFVESGRISGGQDTLIMGTIQNIANDNYYKWRKTA